MCLKVPHREVKAGYRQSQRQDLFFIRQFDAVLTLSLGMFSKYVLVENLVLLWTGNQDIDKLPLSKKGLS